ncbi:MAG: serine hydrolase domain-containing protein [Nocardioidaceae bacterium]
MMDHSVVQDRLTELKDKHNIVGASLALGVGDDTAVAATGTLNRRTGAPATPDSLFQIGSITKVWTATLVMQLVDDGLLDLDAPLIAYLPDFRVLDERVSAAVTPRHLLTHTSGIGGDFFPDTGRGDDCLARYVAQMSDLASSHPLGATMSYCNAGFVVLGRLIQVLRGETWETAVRERLFAPLGLSAAGTLPEEALLWGAAVGHFGTEVTAQWQLPRSAGPTGLIHARAVDLIEFARMHLADGRTATGRVLTAESAEAMRTAQVAIPEPWSSGAHVGLAWMLFDWGRRVFGHDGVTLGQSAFLRIVPGDVPVAIALLTNGGDAVELYEDLFSELLAEHAGVTMPAALRPPAQPVDGDTARVVGTYEQHLMTYVVHERDGALGLTARPSGVLATSLGTDRIEATLIPIAPNAYLTQIPGRAGWLPVVFYQLDDGTPYLHVAGQAAPRTGPPT